MNNPIRIAIIVALAIGITICHYITNPTAGPIHETLQRCYYVPVVLAGLWFGIRGGLLTALLISIAYYPHATHGWFGPSTYYFRLTEMFMFHVIGGLTGFLSSRVQQLLEAEKQARKERENAYQRLREKTEELFSLEEQLRRSDRLAALGRLSAGLAHEIRNPLSSIKTCVTYLRQQNDSPLPTFVEERQAGDEQPDFYTILLEETDRLNRILSNFLDFARLENAQHDDEAPISNVRDTVHRISELLDHQLKSKAIRLSFETANPAICVGVRPSHLQQILLNLILNALDAVPHEGQIQLQSDIAPENNIELMIQDSGEGIANEIADKVFDPFFSTRPDGTGLGLAIVERIISSYGGSIQLDKNHKPRSRFRIQLPAARLTSTNTTI